MKTLHTPGPWEASYHKRYEQWNIFPADDHAVAVVCDLEGHYSSEETASNARLIAIAPELLKELIEAREELKQYHLEATGEDYNKPSMNAAISKAIGETT